MSTTNKSKPPVASAKTRRALESLAKKLASVAEAANEVAAKANSPPAAKKPAKKPKKVAAPGNGALESFKDVIAKHVSMDAEALEMATRLAAMAARADRGDPNITTEARDNGLVIVTLKVPGNDFLAQQFLGSSVAQAALGKIISKKLKGFKLESVRRSYSGLHVQFDLSGKL
jgi:hypothetical protein